MKSNNKKQKKFYIILSVLLALVFTTKAFASLTFTNNAITGTTASTIDLGSGHNLFLQTNGGNVGIGTTAPGATLDVEGSGSLVNIGGAGIDPSVVTINNTSGVNPLEIHSANAQGIDLYTHAAASFRGPAINLYKSRGTQSAPTAVQSGDILSYINNGGYNGSAYTVGASISTIATENWTGSANGMRMHFSATVNGQTAQTNVMDIIGTGVGIGNVALPLNMLDVKGAVAIGSYAGVNTAPSNGLIVSGNVGIGITSPRAGSKLEVAGIMQTDAQSTDPGCTATADIGKFWFDNTTSNTAVKVCKAVSGVVGWSVLTTTP